MSLLDILKTKPAQSDMSDGLWEVVYANGKAVIPTLARLGVAWLTIEPIDVVDWGDKARFQAKVVERIRAGNPQAKSPRDLNLPSPVARAAGFKSERAFEERARGWAIARRSGTYRVIPYKRRKDKGWEEDDEKAVGLPAGASEEMVAACLIDVIKSTLGEM
jgi:hypothetical protein